MGGWTCGSPGGGEAVLQLQHRDDVGSMWGAERAVQVRTDRAVWLEPGWKGVGWGTTVVGLAYDVAGGQGRGGPGQERVGRGAARRRTGCEWGASTIH